MNSSRNLLGCMAVLAATSVVFSTGGARASRSQQKSASGGGEVKIDNFTFLPGTITVPRGTTVNWINRDDIPHTVVSEDKSTFKSKALDTDEKFSYTFSKPGTYMYFCSIHPKMVAKVVVE